MKKKDFTKVKAGEAWICGSCGKPYSKTDHGKIQAQKCCTCRECGDLTAKRMGTADSLCDRCCAKKNLESAHRHFQEQVTFLDEAENEARRYGIPLPPRLSKA